MYFNAQAYLNSEEVLGRALEGRRQDVVIASKFGHGQKKHFEPADIEAAVTQSLTRLKTDHIDLYQVRRGDASFMTDHIDLYQVRRGWAHD